MKILLAIDGSKFSKAATQAIIARTRPRGTQVRVLHVVEPPSLLVTREMGGYDPALDAAWEAESKRAETLVANTAGTLRSKGPKVSTSVEKGDPKSKIVDAASKWRADPFLRQFAENRVRAKSPHADETTPAAPGTRIKRRAPDFPPM